MKKIFFTLALGLTLFSATAQNQIMDLVSPTNSDLFRNKVVNTNKYSKVLGTPYINEKFSLAKISGVQEFALVRYNAEADEFDIDNGENKIYTLPKNNEYTTISFKNGLQKYRLLDYKDSRGKSVNGYLAERINKNGISLLKREKIILVQGKEAANTYATTTQDKLVKSSDEYYLEQKNKEIIEFPSSKKKLINLYPEKKEAITTFLKENDLSFGNETDLVKITEFISAF